MEPPGGEQLPNDNVRRLLVTRDGRLWIGTRAGLASWKDGKLTRYPELAGQAVAALLEDSHGTTWVGGAGARSGRLCAFQNARLVHCYGEDGGLGLGVFSLYEQKSYLWVGAATGLWRWIPEPPKLYPLLGPTPEIPAMIEGDNGALLISLRGEIKQLVDGKGETYALPHPPRAEFRALNLLRDRDRGLWVGTSGHGVLHQYQGRAEFFTSADGLSGDEIHSLLEDREGNIWIATDDGLDRLRDLAVPTISVKQGLSSATVWSILAARDGSIWIGTRGGLDRWNNGQVTTYRRENSGLPDDRADSLFEDDHGRIWASTLRGLAYFENGRFVPVISVPGGIVHTIAGSSNGNIWINDQDHGLFRLLNGRVMERIPWADLGRQDIATVLVPDPVQGGLWLGFSQGGLVYFKDGKIRVSYSVNDGFGRGFVAALQLDRDGTLWAATEGGLSRLKNGRVATLNSKNGPPCDGVQWMLEDDTHSFWLYMPCGLERISGRDLAAWSGDPKRTISPTVFDSSDGVRSEAIASGYSPHAGKSPDGKLWFTTPDGVSVIDPRHLPVNKLPPPVHVEQITADHKTYWQNSSGDASSSLRLPPLIRDLQIDYTALSLAAPEKIRFKYKLEGEDRDWQEVGNRRQAFYSNLAPRNYRFRVAASNNSGVWNEAGASFDFSIAPAYYQTTWFRLSCAAAFLALLAALYQLRLRQVARHFNIRMEERVNERTGIARDLHDTLLQSFQGVLLKFHAVTYLIPDRAAEAQETLETAIEQARQAITEGRDAVEGLRSSTLVTNDLAAAITVLGQEFTGEQAGQMLLSFACKWKAHPGSSLRSCGTRSTRLLARRYAMHSGMRTQSGSRWKSSTIGGSFACGSATTDGASSRRFLTKAGEQDTTDCQGCTSGPNWWEERWPSGVNSIPVRRSS